jgi:hypothetical protein
VCLPGQEAGDAGAFGALVASAPVSMQVGDLVEQGGSTEFFNPTGCTNGLGTQACLVDPSPWYGAQGDQLAYGVRAYGFADRQPPTTNALLSIAGVVATRRPGTFGVLAGQRRLYLRDFVIARDLAEVSSLDPRLFSNDFDAMEVMNGTSASYAVLNDWMTFLS